MFCTYWGVSNIKGSKKSKLILVFQVILVCTEAVDLLLLHRTTDVKGSVMNHDQSLTLVK